MADLIAAASEARNHAYAPYSRYRVGAAIRGADGRIWTGCNVENVASPLGMCAERNAVAAMVRDGCLEIMEVALATLDGGTPCGGCLQVLLEFSPDPTAVLVHMIANGKSTASRALSELIPHGFRSGSIGRTER